MKQLKIDSLLKATKEVANRNMPQILTGIGIAGMVTTVILAVKATPKAIELIEKEKEESGKQELTRIETAKAAWKPYIPAVVTCGASVLCLVSSNSVSTRRTAAIATAYNISQTALSDYKNAVLETIGEKKGKTVREKVAEKKLESDPVNPSTIIMTGNGDALCYDPISGRYFKSNVDKLKKVENEINRRLLLESYISLNEFYDEIGLEHIEIGYDLGWKVESAYFIIDFTSQIAKNGEPAIVLEYSIAPKYGYDRY